MIVKQVDFHLLAFSFFSIFQLVLASAFLHMSDFLHKNVNAETMSFRTSVIIITANNRNILSFRQDFELSDSLLSSKYSDRKRRFSHALKSEGEPEILQAF